MVPALAVAAASSDSPRTSIAVAALAGLAPIDITRFVLLGKLLLYGLLALAGCTTFETCHSAVTGIQDPSLTVLEDKKVQWRR